MIQRFLSIHHLLLTIFLILVSSCGEEGEEGNDKHPSPIPLSFPFDTMEELRNEPYCPRGMVSVKDGGEILYCIDAYENYIEDEGSIGNQDQGSGFPDGSTTSVSVSESGVSPSIGITWYQAYAICSNTPVLDRNNVERGKKRLATSTEWIDACDGVVGGGGTLYPYGSEYVEGACVTTNQNGEQVYSSPQPTGSFEMCVSAFGAFDMVGNVWEWVDTGRRVSIDGFIELALSEGISLQVVPGEPLRVDDPLSVENNILFITNGGSWWCEAEDDGTLFFPPESLSGIDLYYGWLRITIPNGEPLTDDANNLMVDLEEDDGRFVIIPEEDQDGIPVPGKYGGAYYSPSDGPSSTCNTSQNVHVPFFEGTIGFRCTCDPIYE